MAKLNILIMKDKQKPKDWKITKFLKEKAPNLLSKVADVLPNKGGLGIIKNLISNNKELSPEDKEMALKLIEIDMLEMQEVSKRWDSDMTSDSWLSKNVRPLTLIVVVAFLVIMTFFDGLGWVEVDSAWIQLWNMLSVTVVGGYFAVRSLDKRGKVK